MILTMKLILPETRINLYELFAVIDTNVLISALLSDKEDAATVQVVKKIISGDIVPIYSHDIAHEKLYSIAVNSIFREKKSIFC